MAAVCELLPEGQEFLLRAAVGFPEGMVGTLTQPAAPGTSIVGHAVAEEATFVVEDLTDEPRIRRQQGLIALGAASAVVAPIKDRKGAYGALAIFSKVRRQFGPDDISMVEAVAHILTEAMARKQIEQRIEGLVDQLIVTQEEERRRVAYDVHDGLAQLAAATHQYLQAFAYDHRFRSERTRKELADILDLARRTVVDARRVIADLRPLVLDDFGLSVAVEHEVEALREAGWDAAFVDCLAGARLPATVETTLFRIAQECLNNIRKHAGRTRVAVSLALTANEARLVVQDEGAGFNMDSRAKSGPGERVGLMGMQERMRLLRGRLTVDSAVGRGTRVEAAVPVTLTMPEQPAAGEVAEMPVLTV
jgi:signal transduction histidine kinase